MSEAAATVEGGTLRVTGVLDFESVPVLQPIGNQWLRETAGTECRLDLGGVSYSSSVGIALLLDWLRTAQELGKTLHIDNMPAELTALVRVGGLDFLCPLSA